MNILYTNSNHFFVLPQKNDQIYRRKYTKLISLKLLICALLDEMEIF